MDKQMLQLDSAHQIGPGSTSHDFLTVVVMCQEVVKFVGEEFFAGGILNAFACGVRTSSPMDKRRLPLDSAHQIGPGSTTHEFSDCSSDAPWKLGEVKFEEVEF
jgi:hypothetical protein